MSSNKKQEPDQKRDNRKKTFSNWFAKNNKWLPSFTAIIMMVIALTSMIYSIHNNTLNNERQLENIKSQIEIANRQFRNDSLKFVIQMQLQREHDEEFFELQRQQMLLQFMSDSLNFDISRRKFEYETRPYINVSLIYKQNFDSEFSDEFSDEFPTFVLSNKSSVKIQISDIINKEGDNVIPKRISGIRIDRVNGILNKIVEPNSSIEDFESHNYYSYHLKYSGEYCKGNKLKNDKCNCSFKIIYHSVNEPDRNYFTEYFFIMNEYGWFPQKQEKTGRLE